MMPMERTCAELENALRDLVTKWNDVVAASPNDPQITKLYDSYAEPAVRNNAALLASLKEMDCAIKELEKWGVRI